ncbi:hypothetical protein V8E52_010212 [Russula decolorans]
MAALVALYAGHGGILLRCVLCCYTLLFRVHLSNDQSLDASLYFERHRLNIRLLHSVEGAMKEVKQGQLAKGFHILVCPTTAVARKSTSQLLSVRTGKLSADTKSTSDVVADVATQEHTGSNWRHFIIGPKRQFVSARNGCCITAKTFFQLQTWNIEDIDFKCRNNVTHAPRFVHMAIGKSD